MNDKVMFQRLGYIGRRIVEVDRALRAAVSPRVVALHDVRELRFERKTLTSALVFYNTMGGPGDGPRGGGTPAAMAMAA